MAMVVRSNLMAYNANRQLGMNNSAVSKNLEKLSSGFKINRAADDAAGLAISEKMKAQIKGLETASANSQDGISLVQTAEGALTEVHDMLNRMTELATKSANGTIQDEVDRDAIQNEVNKLNDEIDRISESTNFNGIKLLDGSLGGGGTSGKALTGGIIASFKPASVQSGVSTASVTLGQEKLVIDGTAITVDWSTLSATDQAALKKDWTKTDSSVTAEDAKKAASIIENTINKALDDAGTGAKHIKVSASGADGAAKIFTIKSGLEDSGSSSIESRTASALITTLGGLTANTPVEATKSLAGNADMAGNFVMTIDGKDYAITTAAINANGSDVATVLKASIDDVIDNYNAAVPADQQLKKADFTVKLNSEGRLEISNGSNVSIGFKDLEGGSVAKALGISSQGKTTGGGLTLQIGDTGEDFNQVTVSVDNMSSNGIGTSGLNVSNQSSAKSAIDVIKTAINKVSTNRSEMGALQNRLEHTINNLDVAAENMTNANSRIRDTDMAKQMMEYTKMNVLTQSAQAMLAQANQNPQSILQLLQ